MESVMYSYNRVLHLSHLWLSKPQERKQDYKKPILIVQSTEQRSDTWRHSHDTHSRATIKIILFIG